MKLWIALLSCVLAACGSPSPENGAAEAQIREVMMRTWDKPESPLTVDPILVTGHFAIASWTQPALGGRALLQRTGDSWAVVLCAGDDIRQPGLLEHAGLSAKHAADLLQAMTEAERQLSAERRARIAAFRGVVRMDAGHGGGASTTVR